jgi:phosphoserine phosphatase
VIQQDLADRVRTLGRELPGGLALFDADGTLWREDAGEAFLRQLVSLGWVKLPDGSDPYEAYERAVDRDRATGYAYAAQLMAGLSCEEVAGEAARFARGWVPPRLIADTQSLRALCEEAGLTPLVVSASALPIVLAAALLAGFPRERCRGIEVRTRGGRFTDEIVEPVTYARGKIDAAVQAPGSRLQAPGQIALACGDSFTGDLAMMEAARIAVAVAPANGSPLSLEAHRRGWAVLSQDSLPGAWSLEPGA